MKIVLALVVSLLFIGCSDDKSVEAQKEIFQSIDKITKVVKEESVKITKSVEKATEDSVKIITKEARIVSKKVLKETKIVAEKTVLAIDKVLEKPKKIKKPVAPKKVVVPKEAVAVKGSIDGGALFAKCSGCHGVKGDKKALNKSQSIKGWSITKLIDAINGYKDGSYGGSMKGVMKPQVNKLSDDEIKAVSEYISKL
ncbi:c-type cytochrome [Sulfurimonas sp. SAG-AH-194-C21]|nr:c-type cytochrome [Sulfurimonas sp. SAG-AH-194-C21]MDF1883996.1 c-type cytochrome [Sulfurimonas sp. SAG-AH-194-C21]